MGNASSKGEGPANVEDPFPVSASLNRDLDRLSMVAARVLATSDIYDVENLAKPGVCGEYAVFLKKEIEKDVRRILKPFVADVSGNRTDVLYMNPRRSIKSEGVRDKICKSISNSMVRTIAIITACLASIQVAVPARKVAVSGIGLQKGGGHVNVHGWLVANNYYTATDVGKGDTAAKALNVGPISTTDKASFTLQLTSSSTMLTTGIIKASGGPPANPMPTSGSLRVQFMDPVVIPSTSPTPQSVLPIRIVDGAGLPWLAGVLYRNMFKSFVNQGAGKPQQFDLTDVLYTLFRKTQGWTGALFETRTETQNASAVFLAAQRSGSPAANITSAIGPWFYSASGASPAAGVPPPPVPGYPVAGAPPYGYPYGAPPAGAYGAPPAGAYGAIAPVTPAIGMPSLAGALKPPTSSAYYTIPQAASKNLLDLLNDFRNKLAIENSPAAIRAQTLGGVPTRDRTIQTNICQDPYWILPALGRVYPWATLQFLCIQDWSKLQGNRASVVFESEWTNFVTNLGTLYNGSGVPQFERTGTTFFLDQMKFKDINKLSICATAAAPRVKFKEVQDGLLEIQGLYERHVKDIWNLLNDLIMIVEDPDTKQDFVRLHPQVLDAANTETYVATKAAVARKLIADFYYAVEKAYLKAAGTLVVV